MSEQPGRWVTQVSGNIGNSPGRGRLTQVKREPSWSALSAGLLCQERRRTTLSYMKAAKVTIRLDTKLQRELDRLCRQLGRSRSEVLRDALRRQIALLRFERTQRALLPLAEAQGILTDEDVFRIVS